MLENRVALITGATGGLGRVVVKRFLQEHAVIAVVYRSEDKLEELRKYAGDNITGYEADLTDATSVKSLHERVTENLGRVDILLNIAGGYAGGVPMAESRESMLDEMIALNTRSAWLCSRAFLPGMIERNWGRIVSVSAKNATPRGRRAGNIAYAISKEGIITLTEALAEELTKTDVTVNCVLPSTIDTDDNRRKMPKADTSKWVRPQDIAEVILFLSSQSSKAVTGAAIPVFGHA